MAGFRPCAAHLPLALVLVLAVLAGGGVWLSQRGQDGLKAGTLISEDATDAMVGRTAEVRVPWGACRWLAGRGNLRRQALPAMTPQLRRCQVSLGSPEDLLVANRI